MQAEGIREIEDARAWACAHEEKHRGVSRRVDSIDTRLALIGQRLSNLESSVARWAGIASFVGVGAAELLRWLL